MLSYLRRATHADHRRVWALAWPMILSNITVPLLGLVDTAVIGHLPDPRYLGAVAVGAMIFSVLYWAFGFLRMGTTGLTAQALGQENHNQVRLLLAQSLLMGAVIGALLFILQTPLVTLALHLVDAEPAVTAEAALYAQVRICGAPAMLANYALLGWFLGKQNTRIPLILLVSSNLINMLLDILTVYGLGMHTEGVALATVVAEYCSVALGLWFARRLLRREAGVLETSRLWRFSDYYQLIAVNRYIFVRTIAILLTMAFFTAQGAKQGTAVLSANAVLLNFVLLISNGLDGFAHASEALSGKMYGARDRNGFHRTVAAALVWSLVTAALFSVFFWLFGGHIVALLTSIPEVITVAEIYLAWVIILPLLAVWSFLFDGVLIGTTQVKAMQNTMLFSVLLVFLPVWWLTQPLGNHGLWLAFLCLFVARGISCGLVYRRLFVNTGKESLWHN